jgi:hypothetical protein
MADCGGLEARMLSMSCSGGRCCASGENNVPETVPTTLTFTDRLGGWKVRWGAGRMNYKVHSGLYAVGQPDATSPVLVSANYKLTFDALRKELGGLACWLLILDTKGVNVWCAAGKGTFGTNELVERIQKTRLGTVVTHRKLILPQLGAVGVNAHEVRKRSGFSVDYGPVRACDIKEYLASGGKATAAMRLVRFTMLDRLVLTPVELVQAVKKSLPVFSVLFFLNLVTARPFGLPDVVAYVGALVVGAVVTPVLLPLIPGRAFAWKGWLLGLVWTLCVLFFNAWFNAASWLLATGYLLVLPSVSAYLAINFTGSSTYTSFSGVTKEMKTAIPLLALSVSIGISMLLVKSVTG